MKSSTFLKILFILGCAVVIICAAIIVKAYGDSREEDGRDAVIFAYSGGVIQPEYPDKLYLSAKGVPRIRLNPGLFMEAHVLPDGSSFVLDEDEPELPVAGKVAGATTVPVAVTTATPEDPRRIVIPPQP